MKRWKWLFCAALASSMTLSGVQQSQADEQGWGLMVKSPHVGILYLYITSEGFAIVIKETGAKFVTHAPDWRVVMYNDRSQVYYVERLSDLQVLSKSSKAQRGQQMLKNSNSSVRAGKTETIGGLPATQYFIDATSPEGGRREAEVWVTRNIIPPKQLHDTLQKIFSIETSKFPPGLPLRIRMADDAGKRELVFDTLNAQKQMIHTASFTYPPTYRRVDSELAVLMDEKSRKKMESILDDSDDLSSILGSSGSTLPSKSSYRTSSNPGSTPYRPSAVGGSTYRPSYANTSGNRPTATANNATGNKQGSKDWWSNMFNTIGGNK